MICTMYITCISYDITFKNYLKLPQNSKSRLSYLQENGINATCTCLKYPILKK